MHEAAADKNMDDLKSWVSSQFGPNYWSLQPDALEEPGGQVSPMCLKHIPGYSQVLIGASGPCLGAQQPRRARGILAPSF